MFRRKPEGLRFPASIIRHANSLTYNALMPSIDLSKNPRIPRIINLLQSLPTFHDAHEMVKHFVHSMNRAYTTRSYIQIATRGLPKNQYRIQHILGESGNTIIEYRADANTTPISEGGLLAQIISTPDPKILNDVNLSHEPLLDGKLGRYKSLMAVPVVAIDIPIDWVVIL